MRINLPAAVCKICFHPAAQLQQYAGNRHAGGFNLIEIDADPTLMIYLEAICRRRIAMDVMQAGRQQRLVVGRTDVLFQLDYKSLEYGQWFEQADLLNSHQITIDQKLYSLQNHRAGQQIIRLD